MKYQVEFVEFVHKTGATTDRALFRVYEGEAWLFSVVSGVSLTLLAILRCEEPQIREAQRIYAQRLIERQLVADPGWVESSRGGTEVTFDLNTYNVDTDELRRLVNCP